MPEIFGCDCYSPREIAERVEAVGVNKANLPLVPMLALGVLAGGFIGLGAMFATLVLSDAQLSFAISRVLAGMVVSLGLILVVIAGAELFTGNNLLVMACVSHRITVRKRLGNFIIVWFANFIGAAGLAAIIALSGHADIGIPDVLRNLVPVTLGNLVVGAGMVGLVYHTIYRRGPPQGEAG